MNLLHLDKGTAGDRTQRGVVLVSSLLIGGMFVSCIIFGQSVPDDSSASGLGVGLTAFALFGAAAAVGAGLGFLFGLPRSRYADFEGSGQSNAATSTKSPEMPRSAHYLTNSNLIKVSDWLTTIIIGVGLVNLAKIGPAVGDLSNTLETALGGAAYAGIAAVSVIVIALLASIILCYLWTSIRVRELLEESEGQTEKDTEKDVPQLIGLTVRDARMVLLESTLILETNGAGEDERITGQTPLPWSTARRGSKVSITVSSQAATTPQPP